MTLLKQNNSRLTGYLFLLFYITVSALAQESRMIGSEAKELDQIKARLEEEEAELAKIKKSQSEIEIELKKAASEYKEISTYKKSASDKLGVLKKQEEEQQVLSNKAELKLAVMKADYEKRVRGLYKVKRKSGLLSYLLSADSATDLMRRTYLLSLVADQDKLAWDAMVAQVKVLRSIRTELEENRSAQEKNLRSLDELTARLAEHQQKKIALLQEDREKLKQKQQVIARLKESALRLERVLAGIMGGKEKNGLAVESKGRIAKEEDKLESYQGSGLAGFKGRLVFPVDGKIVWGFGKRRYEEFSEQLPNKGWEISASSGSPVRAVARGKVIFSQNLASYGRVVIVDHGERYYTLYGRLGQVNCAVSDVIKAGQQIASLAEPDSKGRNFYFELRIKGKAVDPQGYFK